MRAIRLLYGARRKSRSSTTLHVSNVLTPVELPRTVLMQVYTV